MPVHGEMGPQTYNKMREDLRRKGRAVIKIGNKYYQLINAFSTENSQFVNNYRRTKGYRVIPIRYKDGVVLLLYKHMNWPQSHIDARIKDMLYGEKDYRLK